MQTNLTAYVQENLRKIKLLLEKIKNLEEELKRKKDSLERIENLYKNGFIEEYDYKKLKNSILEEINVIESKVYELIGQVKEVYDETKGLIRFDKEVKRLTKRNTIKIEYPKIEPIITKVETVIKQYLPPPEIKKTGKIEYSKRFLELKRILSLEKPKSKKKIRTKVKIRKRRKVEINYLEELYKISNKIFGNLSDNLIRAFPSLYIFIYELLRKAGIRITVRTYLSVILLSILIIFLIIIPLFLLLPLDFGSKLLCFFAVLSSFIFIIFYYPDYVRKQKAETIRATLPFAIVHMASLAKSGLNPKEIFKVIAETKEYKYLADEFSKLVEYMDLGMGLSDAIKAVAEETPSIELKEFLEGLLLALQSGSSLKEYLEVSAESAIIHYKSQNEKFIQTIKTFSDIYVGMVVTMPILFVSVVVMLASLAERVFGLPIPLLTYTLVYLVVPAINLIMLLIISRIQPK